jgi:hypothetical protein
MRMKNLSLFFLYSFYISDLLIVGASHDGIKNLTVIFGRVEKAENWPIFDI